MLCAGLSLSITSVVAEPALVVLKTARCPSAITIRKLLGVGGGGERYYLQDLEIIWHT